MKDWKLIIGYCADLAVVKECYKCGAYDKKTAKAEVDRLVKSVRNRYSVFEIDCAGMGIILNVAENVFDDFYGFSFDELPQALDEMFDREYLDKFVKDEWVTQYAMVEKDVEMLKRQCL